MRDHIWGSISGSQYLGVNIDLYATDQVTVQHKDILENSQLKNSSIDTVYFSLLK